MHADDEEAFERDMKRAEATLRDDRYDFSSANPIDENRCFKQIRTSELVFRRGGCEDKISKYSHTKFDVISYDAISDCVLRISTSDVEYDRDHLSELLTNGYVSVFIAGNMIFYRDLGTNIFLCDLIKRHIVYESDYIDIPLYIFDNNLQSLLFMIKQSGVRRVHELMIRITMNQQFDRPTTLMWNECTFQTKPDKILSRKIMQSENLDYWLDDKDDISRVNNLRIKCDTITLFWWSETNSDF